MSHNSDFNANINYCWLWKLYCPNKIKLFLWLVTHYRLPTNQHLNSICIVPSPNCYFCGEIETCKHIFMGCVIVEKH
ncbi:hypothetical protein R3W88_016679 [Solanum pinnatisectum]|uniref:Reverse transcriptase zinc-binding domain-containing protein n=1 Tax=Solanum pinnatisectum TaxID=50273 RepID=A0AAV9KYF5_9SOLN|nr:hypothetical protein R3W88_016679 [Solanum pinnatisectum]